MEKVCPHCQALVLYEGTGEPCPACGEPLGDDPPGISAPDAVTQVGPGPELSESTVVSSSPPSDEATLTGDGAAVAEEPVDPTEETEIWNDLPVHWEKDDNEPAPSTNGSAPAVPDASAPVEAVPRTLGMKEFLEAVGPPITVAPPARPAPPPPRPSPAPSIPPASAPSRPAAAPRAAPPVKPASPEPDSPSISMRKASASAPVARPGSPPPAPPAPPTVPVVSAGPISTTPAPSPGQIRTPAATPLRAIPSPNPGPRRVSPSARGIPVPPPPPASKAAQPIDLPDTSGSIPRVNLTPAAPAPAPASPPPPPPWQTAVAARSSIAPAQARPAERPSPRRRGTFLFFALGGVALAAAGGAFAFRARLFGAALDPAATPSVVSEADSSTPDPVPTVSSTPGPEPRATPEPRSTHAGRTSPTRVAVATPAPATPPPTPRTTPATPRPTPTPPTPTPTPPPTPRPTPTPTPPPTPPPTPRPTPTPPPTPPPTPRPTPTPRAAATQTTVALRAPADPRDSTVRNLYGRVQRGDVDEGVRELRSFVKENDDYPDGHYYLALGYVSQGETGKACKELNRYLELAPHGPYAAQARQSVANCD